MVTGGKFGYTNIGFNTSPYKLTPAASSINQFMGYIDAYLSGSINFNYLNGAKCVNN